MEAAGHRCTPWQRMAWNLFGGSWKRDGNLITHHHPCLAELPAESAAPSLCWNGRSEEKAEKAEAPRMSTKYWSYKPPTKSEGDQNRMLLDADGCVDFPITSFSYQFGRSRHAQLMQWQGKQ